MQECWFVLLRFWLRVDGLLVRLHETRYLCELTTPRQALPRCAEAFSTKVY